MKTILTKEVNGMKIIVGFSDPVIDAVETEKYITPLLKDEKEIKDIQTRVKEINNRQRMSRSAAVEAVKAKKRNDKTTEQKNYKEFEQHQEKIQAIMLELKNLKEPLRQKRIDLILKHAIYFMPKEGEIIISDEQYESFRAVEIPEYAMLSIDGNVIFDYSGYDIWTKGSGSWQKIILSFGDKLPAGAIVEKDLTEEQKLEIAEQVESDRIAGLLQTEKDAEKQNIIDGLANQAASMRSALEIQGDNKALEKSQDWYNEQVAIIEEKYN